MFDLDRLKSPLLISIAFHVSFFLILYILDYTPIEHSNDYLIVDFNSTLISEEGNRADQITMNDSDTKIPAEGETANLEENNLESIEAENKSNSESDSENFQSGKDATDDQDTPIFDINFGKMGTRKIFSYVLPPIELGDSKEINIKLSFVILPDGTVGNIIPLKKVNTSLETQAIESLRQWRFEPLLPGKIQNDQTATIVFPFRQR